MGLGFKVCGFRVWSLRFRVYGFRVWGLRFRVYGFKVKGLRLSLGSKGCHYGFRASWLGLCLFPAQRETTQAECC